MAQFAGPILDAQHVSRFRQVRHDRVVTGHLPMMGIKPAEGALDLQTGRDHHAVHINRPRAHAQRREHARDDRRVDRLQGHDSRHREPLQPPTRGARRRHNLDFAEALEQRIVLEIREVAQASAPHDQQPDHQSHHRSRTEVAPPRRPGTRRADRGIEAVARRYCPNSSSPAYEVSATSANSSGRFPLTRARKSVLLRLTSGGLSLMA
jgi:hypothetical protein